MPNPIPRNRSAGGRPPRRPVRQQAWPILPFRRPRENVRQPEPPPPPPQPRPRARHRATPDTPFRRPQENITLPGPLPPQPRRPARHRATPGLPFQRPQDNVELPAQPPRQPRPPAQQRVWPDLLFRRPTGNAGRAGPLRPPHPTPSGIKVAVGALFLTAASLVVWIAVPLFSLDTPMGSTAAPPVSDHADIAAAPGNDLGPVGGQLAVPPDASAGVDRGPTTESPALVGLAAVRRDDGPPVTGSQPNSAQPAQPSQPANVADPGRRVDPPAPDQGQHAPRPPKRSPAEENPPTKPQKPPAPPPVTPGPTPEERREQLARRLAQVAQEWKANSGTGKPTSPPASQGSGPTTVAKQKESRTQPGTDGPQNAQGRSGSGVATRSSTAKSSSNPSRSSSSSSKSSSSSSKSSSSSSRSSGSK